MMEWPATLPLPLIDGNSYQRFDIGIRTELPTGREEARRRFGDGSARASVSWMLHEAQLQAFESFYHDDLKGGTQPFTMPFMVGTGLVDHTFKFLDAYEAEKVSDAHYRVSAPMFIKRLSVYDANTIDVFDEYGDLTSFPAFIDIFDIYVNVDLPASEMGT